MNNTLSLTIVIKNGGMKLLRCYQCRQFFISSLLEKPNICQSMKQFLSQCEMIHGNGQREGDKRIP